MVGCPYGADDFDLKIWNGRFIQISFRTKVYLLKKVLDGFKVRAYRFQLCRCLCAIIIQVARPFSTRIDRIIWFRYPQVSFLASLKACFVNDDNYISPNISPPLLTHFYNIEFSTLPSLTPSPPSPRGIITSEISSCPLSHHPSTCSFLFFILSIFFDRELRIHDRSKWSRKYIGSSSRTWKG